MNREPAFVRQLGDEQQVLFADFETNGTSIGERRPCPVMNDPTVVHELERFWRIGRSWMLPDHLISSHCDGAADESTVFGDLR